MPTNVRLRNFQSIDELRDLPLNLAVDIRVTRIEVPIMGVPLPLVELFIEVLHQSTMRTVLRLRLQPHHPEMLCAELLAEAAKAQMASNDDASQAPAEPSPADGSPLT